LQSFVSTIPGLAPFVLREARRRARVTSDGRADLVAFEGPPPQLRTAEHAFVRVDDLRALTRPVRLVVRVQDESRYKRTELRRRYAQRLGRLVTERESADELWVLQTRERQIWVGLRVRDPRRVQRIEWPGALRPAVAAAMLQLVVDPSLVVDPCCGSGTIPLAASDAVGGDLDPAAVRAARANGVVALLRADARRVPLRDGAGDVTAGPSVPERVRGGERRVAAEHRQRDRERAEHNDWSPSHGR